jgi:hypothetical protein
MKNKNSLSETEQAEAKATRVDSEKKLLPRLKFMGYVMAILCIAAVTFAIVAPEPDGELEPFASKLPTASLALESEDELLELTPAEVLNYYVIGAVFALVGGACFFICWRKEKHFFSKNFRH